MLGEPVKPEARSAVPVTLPVRGPLKPVAVIIPVAPVTVKPLSKVVVPWKLVAPVTV